MFKLAHVLLAGVIGMPALALAQSAPTTITPGVTLPSAPVVLAQEDAKPDQEALQAFLPDPMEGWTRETITEIDAAQLQIYGGGTIAMARYLSPDETVEMVFVIDAPFVQQMVPIFSNTMMMSMAGDVFDLNGRSFVETDAGDIVGLVDGRVLVNVDTRRPETARAYLALVDFDALEGFGTE